MSTPETRLLAAMTTTIAIEYVNAAHVFPQKISRCEHERVRIVFQVDCRSSLAKMSPATTLAIRGNPSVLANWRTTNGMASPEMCTHLPNSESAGTVACVLMKIVKASG